MVRPKGAKNKGPRSDKGKKKGPKPVVKETPKENNDSETATFEEAVSEPHDATL